MNDQSMTDLSIFQPLSPAEERLVQECSDSARITLTGGELPEAETPETHVRAEFIRHVLVSDTIKLTAKGLRLRGAWITGVLDLQGADIPHDLSLSYCVIDSGIELVNARMRGLYLSGCQMRSLSGDNADLDGALFIRGGTVVDGDVSLAGARISGDLQVCDVTIQPSGQDAIFAPSLRVEGSVYLGNYPFSTGTTSLVADGAVFLSSLIAGSDVFVTNCAIAPPNDGIPDTIFYATEEHGRDIALSLARARVGGLLYFRDNQIARGILNLAGAEVTRFRDEPDEPGASYPIRLDGFRYNDFSRHADTTVATRLNWLERRPKDTPFTAQPYEQLARVLIDMGHRNDARAVLMSKERLLRQANRDLMVQNSGYNPRWAIARFGDMVLRFSVGYGYRPGRIIVLAVVLIAALGWIFDQTWKAGDMTPNAAPILVSKDWIAATQSHPENPGAFWSQPDQAGKDWETFNAYAYAADLVVPIVSLGQESAWAPSTSRSDWGRFGWWLRWIAKALGWVITALGAAAVTGAVRQE